MNLRTNFRVALLATACWVPTQMWAQLSTNPDKFLGNITTYGQVDAEGVAKYYTLWNQITPENESKWQSIEGNSRGTFNWYGCDNAYNYAKNHNFPFKFHTLVWGSQYPTWINSLSKEEQYKAVVEWMDAVKKRYPDLKLIDVVNEAISGHAPAPYKEALGGDGKTGYDWIIKAFEMAAERWPDAILIYNDYNTFQWNTQQFIDLVKTLRDAGAPIDAYGCQSHDLNDISFSDFKKSMNTLQSNLKMPMYSTEYDIASTDDAKQLQQYKDQIPYMWEADYCAGVTLWGYVYGKTWTDDGKGYSGIIKDGKDRSAMTWLREYMATDAAKKAKSPFPGMVKEASVYIKPASIIGSANEVMPIEVNARLKTKTIKEVALYANNQLVKTLTKAPYEVDYIPSATGRYDLKAVVTATDGSKYERVGGFTVYPGRKSYGDIITLPGILQAEDFDSGAEGLTYHDSDSQDEGQANYRKDNGGVDIGNGNNGYVIGYTAQGEWLEYTVDVKQSGYYTCDATVASGLSGSGFTLSLADDGKTEELCKISIPQTGDNSWDTYKVVNAKIAKELKAGKHIFRITITGPYGNIDKLDFMCVQETSGINAVENAENTSAVRHNIQGMKVDANYKGVVIKNGKKVKQ